jgi:hypothetical protein
MIQDIKDKLPYLPENKLSEFYYVYSKLKQKAKKQYGFNFELKIDNTTKKSLYGFSSFEFNDSEKKISGFFNLDIFVNQLNTLDIEDKYSLESSAYFSLIASLFHTYTKGLVYFKYRDQLSKYNEEVLKISMDYIHLYFCEDVLNFPKDQIFNKLTAVLHEFNNTQQFDYKDELADYCLQVLNPICFEIARSHAEFSSNSLEKETYITEQPGEPGQAPMNNYEYDTRK